MAKNTPAKLAANARYDKKTYDTFLVKMRKDAEITLDDVRDHAARYDKSTNSFIVRAILNEMQRDRAQDGY